MKRSRRSLGFLLATMSLSLAVVRTTTLPACPLPTVQNDKATLAPVVAVAKTVDSVERPPLNVAPPAVRHAVSCTSFIVVLPEALVDERPHRHTGWSGCTAYSYGCDHLGRSVALATPLRSNAFERFVLAELQRLVTLATRASVTSASVVCQLVPPHDQPQVLASDRDRERK
jgi:hypothetical protein